MTKIAYREQTHTEFKTRCKKDINIFHPNYNANTTKLTQHQLKRKLSLLPPYYMQLPKTRNQR